MINQPSHHRRSAESAFEEALAQLEKLPEPEVQVAKVKSKPRREHPQLEEEAVWEEAAADLEAFFEEKENKEV